MSKKKWPYLVSYEHGNDLKYKSHRSLDSAKEHAKRAPGASVWRNKEDGGIEEIGEQDKNFYGHYLPSHFKETNIINTKGRVR